MRIAILHNVVDEAPTPDDADTLVQAEAVGAALFRRGHEVGTLGCDLDLYNVKGALYGMAPDVVFNLVEGLDGAGRLIHVVPAFVEHLGFAMTGASADAIYRSSHKVLAKAALEAAGLPVPRLVSARAGDGLSGLTGRPVIIKSLWEHASKGLEDDCVRSFASHDALEAALAELRGRLGGACFAEEFIDGRELNLSVLERPGGPQVLPPAEIRFEGLPPGSQRMVGYRAKWAPGAAEYEGTQRSFEFPASDGPLLEELERLALRAFAAFELRGYARVDFRVDAAGAPYVLEVNANPCISPDAGFAWALDRAGIDYADAIDEIVAAALHSSP